MYVETSAIVAILTGGPDGPELLSRIDESPSPTTSIVTKVEAALAIGRAMGDIERSAEVVDAFPDQMAIRVDSVAPDLYGPVMQAAARYGKGSGRPEKLNFGDCFSYAMAKYAGQRLLYRGDDFSKTDLA